MSGNKERVGIRHRASNTLFLSSLIDPYQIPYMKIHMALHGAIVKDAMDRASFLQTETELPAKKGQKPSQDGLSKIDNANYCDADKVLIVFVKCAYYQG